MASSRTSIKTNHRTGMGGRYGKLDPRYSVKIQEVAERKELRASRSSQEQIKLLDQRLGKGIGAFKERSRLLLLIKQTQKG